MTQKCERYYEASWHLGASGRLEYLRYWLWLIDSLPRRILSAGPAPQACRELVELSRWAIVHKRDLLAFHMRGIECYPAL